MSKRGPKTRPNSLQNSLQNPLSILPRVPVTFPVKSMEGDSSYPFLHLELSHLLPPLSRWLATSCPWRSARNLLHPQRQQPRKCESSCLQLPHPIPLRILAKIRAVNSMEHQSWTIFAPNVPKKPKYPDDFLFLF